MTSERELAEAARAWPFVEARNLIKRLNGKTPDKGYVLFQTGYGPSGLPHIGTTIWTACARCRTICPTGT